MTTLLIFLTIFFLSIVTSVSLSILIGILSLNIYELKRKAQLGDKYAKKAYQLKIKSSQLVVMVIVAGIIANSVIILLINSKINAILTIILSTIIIAIFSGLIPALFLKKYSLKLTYIFEPVFKYLLTSLSPITKPIARFIDNKNISIGATIYNKEELFSILNDQILSNTSGIKPSEIKIVKHALNFGDKQVREIMIPRRMVVSVYASEKVSLLMIDELHKSGFSRFPVYEDKQTDKFVGTLYLRDLINLKHQGLVSDIMREIYYVHEEQTLDHALKAFLQTSHHLLVVVNTFEEFVGVLALEDVIEAIIGSNITDEFDQHSSIREVAKSLAVSERAKREAQEKQTAPRLKTSKKSEK